MRHLATGPAAPSPAEVDARMGMAWFNGLTRAQRAYWLDRAWRRASPVYSLDAMPSAADAWEAFKGRPSPDFPNAAQTAPERG
ncbi:MAG TPA: hypothetical protein VMF03_21275 [Steroidobacteraceae bacterium]|nr:hypothetical protein [Steroidobacteraceae bacterium]